MISTCWQYPSFNVMFFVTGVKNDLKNELIIVYVLRSKIV